MKNLLRIFILALFVYPSFVVASSNGLVIDEFQIGIPDNAYDEYVVIANYGSSAVKLDGYSLSRKTKSGTTYSNLYTDWANYYLQPNQKIVIGHSKYSGVADFRYSTTSYLSNDYTIALLAPGKIVVDLVGYGDAMSFEGSVLPKVNAGDIYKRRDGVDTDNNLNDFYLLNEKEDVVLDPDIDKIVISEILPNPDSGEEWFEIFNTTNKDISLFGLKVCDGTGSIHCFSFPETEKIGPFAYKTYGQSKTRITLNNAGDELYLYDQFENIIFQTDSFTDAADGESFSLFGAEWRWTLLPTKDVQNLFKETLIVESKPLIVKKKTPKKKKKSTVKKASIEYEVDEETPAESEEVKGAGTVNKEKAKQTEEKVLGTQELGWAIIGLAVIILVAYFINENKEKFYETYNKFKRRNN